MNYSSYTQQPPLHPILQQWIAHYQSQGYDYNTAYQSAVHYFKAQYPSAQIHQPVYNTQPVGPSLYANPFRPTSYASAVSSSNLFLTLVPAYTAVKKPVETKKPLEAKDEWPESLKNYITRVFKSCSPEKKPLYEARLKDIIVAAQNRNAIWTTNWDIMPIPGYFPNNTSESPSVAKKPVEKSKLFFEKVSRSSRSESPNMSNLEIRSEEELKKQMRHKRFQEATDEMERKKKKALIVNEQARQRFLAAGSEGNPDVLDWDEYTIIGTCQTLEKRYLRLTSAPDPSTVRPLNVLRKTLEFLKDKWKKEGNYAYICDQFKSLRQDLTVQRIKNAFTVSVYEIHARIALEKGDLGEYNQCQAQLKQLYSLGLEGNENEFIAYRILYMIHTLNRQELYKTISNLTLDQRKSENIRHALQTRQAISQGDYSLLFEHLYPKSPAMSSYLIDQFIDRERTKALLVICKAYRPSIHANFVAYSLGFIDSEAFDVKDGKVKSSKLMKQGMKKFLEFVKSFGLTWTEKKQELIDTKASLPNLMHKCAELTQKIDIKGQI